MTAAMTVEDTATDEPIFLVRFEGSWVRAVVLEWDEDEAQCYEGWGYLRVDEATHDRALMALHHRRPLGEGIPVDSPSLGEVLPVWQHPSEARHEGRCLIWDALMSASDKEP